MYKFVHSTLNAFSVEQNMNCPVGFCLVIRLPNPLIIRQLMFSPIWWKYGGGGNDGFVVDTLALLPSKFLTKRQLKFSRLSHVLSFDRAK